MKLKFIFLFILLSTSNKMLLASNDSVTLPSQQLATPLQQACATFLVHVMDNIYPSLQTDFQSSRNHAPQKDWVVLPSQIPNKEFYCDLMDLYACCKQDVYALTTRRGSIFVAYPNFTYNP